MVLIGASKYLDFLSKFGVSGAHPGGIELTKKIFEYEKIDKFSQVLDVGCGTGQTAAYLAAHYGAKITGLDVNPIMVEKAKNRMKKSRLPVKIIQGSIEKFPIKGIKYDFILSESVLSFVNMPKALKEIIRLLKNDGRFIANELSLSRRIGRHSEEEIKQFYGFDSIHTEKEWITLFKQTGFKKIETFLKAPPLLENQSMPEFQYSKNIERELYEIMHQHMNLTAKYLGVLDYKVFLCTK
ncbi:class I SAM-dependent methyltransferase [Bacillus sp. EB01]|uniref:class I SAM-dependent methyltransferase n=1 Tax=Bacillus sp. EB01 TaxID=1347086 RepID=UPI000694C109|nr:class I SAM-dependent methyltransferase [Bacillus sp. EB01]